MRPLHPAVHPLLGPLVASAAAAGLVLTLGAARSTSPTAARSVPSAVTSAAATSPAVARPSSAPPPLQSAKPAERASRSHRSWAWVRPAPGPVTSAFGRRWGGFHPGIDIGAHYGAPVHAITGGRIVSAGWISGYGKTVRVRAHGLVFYYPHLSRILRRHGVLATGAVLGRVGSTGFSTGPHLHVEIRRHGRPVNPWPILVRHGVRL